MYAFCEQRGLTLPPRRLGTEASSKSQLRLSSNTLPVMDDFQLR